MDTGSSSTAFSASALTPTVKLLAGYGLDDPRDGELAADQRAWNEVFYGTVMWEPVSFLRLGLEVSRFRTDYIAPSRDNETWVQHLRADYRF